MVKKIGEKNLNVLNLSMQNDTTFRVSHCDIIKFIQVYTFISSQLKKLVANKY